MNITFLVSLLPAFVYYLMKSNKSLHILQQNWYNEGNRYITWIIKNRYKVFIELDMFFIIFITLMFFDTLSSMVIFIVFYCLAAILYIRKMKNEQEKKKLEFTKRAKRLIITEILIFLLVVLITSLYLDELNLYIMYLIFGGLIYLNYIVLLIANYINKPVEKLVYKFYMNKAKHKLGGMKNLEVVGITGSYGKTSSKNILNDILSSKYNTCPTPKNFNTPNGLMITINNYLDKFTDILIAEMGAFKEGEIKELCDFIHPKYGILTTIGTAHLESFGSEDAIMRGKFELIESLPKDGVAVLNADDKKQLSYDIKNECKTIWIGIENHSADIIAKNIKQSEDGIKFEVKFKEDKKVYKFETVLLGTANVYNILSAIALGIHLGISIDQLQTSVKGVKPIEHRLELKKYGDITIIDDAYNSNPIGSKMALDVLNLMKGKKIIVTPGMIELGDKQYEFNMKFGEYIADICDEVILVGEVQTKPIYEGLIRKKYKEKNIHIINDVKLAFELMQELKDKNTYVLLENDLPDIFNEK